MPSLVEDGATSHFNRCKIRGQINIHSWEMIRACIDKIYSLHIFKTLPPSPPTTQKMLDMYSSQKCPNAP